MVQMPFGCGFVCEVISEMRQVVCCALLSVDGDGDEDRRQKHKEKVRVCNE